MKNRATRKRSIVKAITYPKSATQRPQSITETHREIGIGLSVANSSPSPPSPQCSLWLFSAFSVLLVPEFVAARAEYLSLLGGPGFSPAEPKFPSVGFTGCGK